MTEANALLALRWALEDIREIALEHAEGGYGDDGQQGNAWNGVLVVCTETLAHLEGKAPW